MKKVTLLVPCYNEEEVLPHFITCAQKVMSSIDYEWSILLIDDGSIDHTLSIMDRTHNIDKHIDYIELSRNFGKEAAMMAGLDYAKGDAVIIMDADLQHPLEVIPRMLNEWEKGYDDVYARRITRGKETVLRKFFTKLYYTILKASTNVNVYPNVGDFRLLDRCCVNALITLRENNRYTKGLYSYIGFKKQYVDFEQKERIVGNSKWSLRMLYTLAINGILSFSNRPLQISSICGSFVSLSAFIYMLYVLLKAIIYGDPVQGYPSLMVVILFLGGIQLIAIGILGEYIGKTFTETKHRPNYFIRTYNGKKI